MDGIAQLSTNDGNLGGMNLTSLVTSFALQKPTWGQVILKNSISNGLAATADGYLGIKTDMSFKEILPIIGNMVIGVAFDKTIGTLQGLPNKYTSAQVSRFKSLSYKPKYAAQFREYLIKQRVSETLSSIPGTIGAGIINNASNIEIKDEKKTE